jgi:hypothetical protein
MQDVQLLVDGGTLQQYLRFFTTPGPNNTLVYTVSLRWQQQLPSRLVNRSRAAQQQRMGARLDTTSLQQQVQAYSVQRSYATSALHGL